MLSPIHTSFQNLKSRSQQSCVDSARLPGLRRIHAVEQSHRYSLIASLFPRYLLVNV